MKPNYRKSFQGPIWTAQASHLSRKKHRQQLSPPSKQSRPTSHPLTTNVGAKWVKRCTMAWTVLQGSKVLCPSAKKISWSLSYHSKDEIIYLVWNLKRYRAWMRDRPNIIISRAIMKVSSALWIRTRWIGGSVSLRCPPSALPTSSRLPAYRRILLSGSRSLIRLPSWRITITRLSKTSWQK